MNKVYKDRLLIPLVIAAWVLVLLFLFTSCNFQHYGESSLGYAPGFDQGSRISKRRSVLVGARHIAERPLGDTGLTWGFATGFQLSYTEDAFAGHNYDYREYRFREQLLVSYPATFTPYIAGGISYNVLEADSDFVDDTEWQGVVTAGVRYSRYFFEYQGMNTEYEANPYNPYDVNHWMNIFLFGIRF